MTRKAAMALAAGLLMALIAGAAAFSAGLTGPASAGGDARDRKPKVRTIERTITVHEKDRGEDREVRVIPVGSDGAGSAFLRDDEDDDDYDGDGDDGWGDTGGDTDGGSEGGDD